MTNPSQERATRQFITAEMVQESVGKFGADLPWCRTVANRLNGLLAAEFEELEREARLEEVRKAPWVGSMTFDHWKTKRIAELERKLS